MAMTITDAIDCVGAPPDEAALRAALTRILSTSDADERESVWRAASRGLLENCGDKVYYRGLVEFSNRCSLNCYYCGIRAGNEGVERYTLSHDAILDAARFCAASGYGSIVLQSGERRDAGFVDFVEAVVRDIKRETVSDILPQGLGVTLCVGEQSRETYERFLAAGAHRYLLRIETTNAELFVRLHPESQGLDRRLECLQVLQDVGYQVGTGVMIGVPGQTVEMLVGDLLFFRDFGIDMIGMGPYIPHPDVPMAAEGRGEWASDDAYRTGLLMVACARLLLKDVNIAATTALQALDPEGRERGLEHGANVIMPTLTPTEQRGNYLLYEGKPCVDEGREDCRVCLSARILGVGRMVAYNEWGDSRHFHSRQ